jgi:HEPN domain
VTWQPGRQEVIAALRAGELQRVTGGQAAGDGWITQARRKYETARLISDADPESAYVTAYDAARFALVGVLAQQGLRATQKGGHLAVELTVRAQFGPSFVTFSTLRRRRAELEYPSYPGEKVEQQELLDALRTVEQIIDGAAQLVPHLSIFTDS